VTDRVQDLDRADLLIEAGLALASERSLEAVLQRIVELAVDITVARYGAISVLAPDGRIEESSSPKGSPMRSEPRSATPQRVTGSWGC
jgi:hypothetical protein